MGLNEGTIKLKELFSGLHTKNVLQPGGRACLERKFLELYLSNELLDTKA